MFKKAMALLLCLVIVFLLSGCNSRFAMMIRGEYNNNEDKSNTSSLTQSEVEKGIYGKWYAKYPVGNIILSIVQQEFPQANESPGKVVVDYTMEFYDDGKCKAAIHSNDTFYAAVLTCVENYLRSETDNEATVKERLEEYKEKYPREVINAQIDVAKEANFVITGDPYDWGTVQIYSEDSGSKMHFSVNSKNLELTMYDGDVLTNSRMVFVRQ